MQYNTFSHVSPLHHPTHKWQPSHAAVEALASSAAPFLACLTNFLKSSASAARASYPSYRHAPITLADMRDKSYEFAPGFVSLLALLFAIRGFLCERGYYIEQQMPDLHKLAIAKSCDSQAAAAHELHRTEVVALGMPCPFRLLRDCLCFACRPSCRQTQIDQHCPEAPLLTTATLEHLRSVSIMSASMRWPPAIHDALPQSGSKCPRSDCKQKLREAPGSLRVLLCPRNHRCEIPMQVWPVDISQFLRAIGERFYKFINCTPRQALPLVFPGLPTQLFDLLLQFATPGFSHLSQRTTAVFDYHKLVLYSIDGVGALMLAFERFSTPSIQAHHNFKFYSASKELVGVIGPCKVVFRRHRLSGATNVIISLSTFTYTRNTSVSAAERVLLPAAFLGSPEEIAAVREEIVPIAKFGKKLAQDKDYFADSRAVDAAQTALTQRLKLRDESARVAEAAAAAAVAASRKRGSSLIAPAEPPSSAAVSSSSSSSSSSSTAVSAVRAEEAASAALVSQVCEQEEEVIDEFFEANAYHDEHYEGYDETQRMLAAAQKMSASVT